jgi:hypothetical protein
MLKNNKHNIFLFSFLALFLFMGKDSFSQQQLYSLGLNTGVSNFESLSTSISGIQIGILYEFPAWFSKAFNFQTSLFYLRKTEYFLPEDSEGKYYPYFYGGTFSGVMRQRIKQDFFVEEQAGILLMKNKFFSDLSETNYGVSFGLAGGIDFRNNHITGFLLSIGYKGGITFNASKPSFNSFFLQTQYFF